jgi:hypothetical protein
MAEDVRNRTLSVAGLRLAMDLSVERRPPSSDLASRLCWRQATLHQKQRSLQFLPIQWLPDLAPALGPRIGKPVTRTLGDEPSLELGDGAEDVKNLLGYGNDSLMVGPLQGWAPARRSIRRICRLCLCSDRASEGGVHSHLSA